MSDAAIYDEELKSLEEQVRNLLRALDSATNTDVKLEKYNKAQDYMKRLHKTHHQFKVEVRLLDGNEQEVYEKRSQMHLRTINQLKEELQSKRIENISLSAPNLNSGWSSGLEKNDGKDEARAAAARINTIQGSTLESLAMTERLLNETETVGTGAATTLRVQTEQIQRVNDNLDELDSDVNRAKKELNAFIRRMMTDKIIICFSILIVIGIIVIIVLKVVKKK
ncbi:putative transmembrane protein [Trypanosoma theileri]|uniref:Putative transmembrane protein n=1 Tax=Trypanosoma theileri TaxID=67003 RepID=A0A1X0NUE9_9TRYP|nr:putative transmembrane protein [Trypanosoma theileri]ORC87819.1 putative transmembrane protein [Trypanosoma theileri]